MTRAKGPTFDPAAATGFAAMVLHATADALDTADDAVPGAIANLSELSGCPLDLSAGILLATTAVLATAGVTADQLHQLAATYTAEAEKESTEQ